MEGLHDFQQFLLFLIALWLVASSRRIVVFVSLCSYFYAVFAGKMLVKSQPSMPGVLYVSVINQ